jgi:hypothetical protein
LLSAAQLADGIASLFDLLNRRDDALVAGRCNRKSIAALSLREGEGSNLC